jgi:ribosome-associated translation inhibitor RaiA
VEAFDVITLTKGAVSQSDRAYAEEKLQQLSKVAPRHIQKLRLKLVVLDVPHLSSPASVQANIDVADGSFVRTRVEASTIREAADMVHERASRKLRRISEKYVARRSRGGANDGWHHGDVPTSRTAHFPRSSSERELIRQKSIGTSEATADEAAFDMTQLDYDFYVFTDIETGGGAFLHHINDGAELVLQYATGLNGTEAKYASQIDSVNPNPVRTMSVPDALQTLNDSQGAFTFFVDTESGEPSVAYHRYDGHYGLLTARSK